MEIQQRLYDESVNNTNKQFKIAGQRFYLVLGAILNFSVLMVTFQCANYMKQPLINYLGCLGGKNPSRCELYSEDDKDVEMRIAMLLVIYPIVHYMWSMFTNSGFLNFGFYLASLSMLDNAIEDVVVKTTIYITLFKLFAFRMAFLNLMESCFPEIHQFTQQYPLFKY